MTAFFIQLKFLRKQFTCKQPMVILSHELLRITFMQASSIFTLNLIAFDFTFSDFNFFFPDISFIMESKEKKLPTEIMEKV